MRVRILLLTLALPAANAAAQAPGDRAQAVQVKTARIAGTVVSAEREPKPVRRARVTLNNPAQQIGRTAITEDDGRFLFDALPPGQYNVAATRTGFISTAYGASGRGRPGVPVTITSGTQATITITLPKGSAISGMLTDPEGQPLPGLQVRALTYRIIPPGGERRLTEVQHPPVVTDDRGLYRIFGLAAGEYAIAVRPRFGAQAMGFRAVSPADVRQALAEVREVRSRRPLTAPASKPSIPEEPQRRFAMASVFFPGTTVATHARLISVGHGEERNGIDFQVEYVAVARVAGSVLASTGGATRAYVRLVPDPHETLLDEGGFRAVATEPDGTFAFDYVPPGRYVLAARASADGSMALRYDATSSLWASTEIVINGEDIPNVTLVPVPGLTVEGRLTFQGERPAPRLAALRMIGLPLWSRSSPGGSPTVIVEDDGRFTVPSVPAGRYLPEYAAGIRTPLGAWWLKSIVIAGQEALDSPLELRESVGDVTVTFADTASELSGRVVDSAGDAVSYCTVVVFPVERRSWFFNSRRIAAVQPDPQGRYAIRNLPPGNYLMVARSDLDPLEWFDPGSLEKLAASATVLTIQNDGSTAQDITVPARIPR